MMGPSVSTSPSILKSPSVLKSHFVFIMVVIFFTACGGSGSGNNQSEPTLNSPPVVNVNDDFSIDELMTAHLNAQPFDSDGSIQSITWSQSSGITVVIENADTNNASFIAPEVNQTEILTFDISVTDNDGAIANDSINVTVLDIPDDVERFTVGGRLEGATSEIQISLNSEETIELTANGEFSFAMEFSAGSDYLVLIEQMPNGQTCQIENHQGLVNNNVTNVNISCETVQNDDLTEQPENQSSGGALVLESLRVSRNICVSPCPVVMSIDSLSDQTAINPFTDTGVYWYFDDQNADERDGKFERGAQFFNEERNNASGASRTYDTNTPIAVHTYHCDIGTCTFYPGVSVQNEAGDWATAWSTIIVEAQDTRFANHQTYCYSGVGNFEDCPAGAHQQTSNRLPHLNEWQSNTRHLLRVGESFNGDGEGEICLPLDRKNIFIGSFGSGNAKPVLTNNLVIGADSNCSDRVVNDAQALNFDVGRWVEDITITGLRLPNLRLGMTFQNISLHDVDMNYETSEVEGGGISMFNSNYCSKNASLSCENVPLPRGLYLSSMDIVGSRQSPPIYNVGLLESVCISFLGVLDSTLGVSYGHSMRVQCSSRVAVMHSDFLGEHLDLTNGPRNALTLRPSGNLEIDMLDVDMRRSDAAEAGGYDNLFQDRYSVVKDVYFGTPASINNSARIKIAPANTGQAGIVRNSLISGIVSDMDGGSGDGPASRDVAFAGTGLTCYTDNILETTLGCDDLNPGAIPEGGFEPSRTILPPEIPVSPIERL